MTVSHQTGGCNAVLYFAVVDALSLLWFCTTLIHGDVCMCIPFFDSLETRNAPAVAALPVAVRLPATPHPPPPHSAIHAYTRLYGVTGPQYLPDVYCPPRLCAKPAT